MLDREHVVLMLTERSPLLVESFGDLLVLFNTTVRCFVLAKYRPLSSGNRLLCLLTGGAGSRPDNVSVCVLDFLFVGKVETPFLSLLLVSSLTPSIDDIHESFSSLPGVLASVLILRPLARLHIK